jgi:hypothetical protein
MIDNTRVSICIGDERVSSISKDALENTVGDLERIEEENLL